jgi:hypothetical protein
MDKINTAKVAEDATAGKGCSILDAFKGQSFDDQMNAINELRNAKVEGIVPYVFISDGITPSALGIEKHTPTIRANLFDVTFDPLADRVHYECADVDVKVETRSVDSKF